MSHILDPFDIKRNSTLDALRVLSNEQLNEVSVDKQRLSGGSNIAIVLNKSSTKPEDNIHNEYKNITRSRTKTFFECRLLIRAPS